MSPPPPPASNRQLTLALWAVSAVGLGLGVILTVVLGLQSDRAGWYLVLAASFALGWIALFSWLLRRSLTRAASVEQTLRASEERLRRITDSTLDLIGEIDLQGRFCYASPSSQAITGYEPQQLIGQPVFHYVHPDDLSAAQASFQEIIDRRSAATRLELRARRADNRYLWLESINHLVLDEQAHPRSIVLIARDITHRKQAEDKLDRYARNMATLYEISLEINSQPDTANLLRLIVKRASELLGTSMSGLYLISEFDNAVVLVASQPTEFVGTVLRLGEGAAGRVAQTGEPLVIPDYSNWLGRSLAFEGRRFGRVLVVPLKLHEAVIGSLAIDDSVPGTFSEEDIRVASLLADQATLAIENRQLLEQMQTELLRRNRMELALRDSEQRYRTLIENQGEGICLVDVNENLTFANPAADDIFGMPRGALAGHNLSEFVVPEEFADIRQETQLRRAGQISTYESRIIRPDGQQRTLLVTARPQFDNSASFLGAFAIFRDITARKAAEEELARTQADLEKRNQQLTQILEAGNTLRLTLDSDQVLREIVYNAQRSLGYGTVVLNILDPASRKLRVHSFAGLDEAGREMLEHAEYDLAQELQLMRPEFALGRAYFIPDGALDWETETIGLVYTPSLTALTAPDAWKSEDALFIPIELRNGEVVGTIWLDAPLDGKRPTLESLRPLEIFANQVVIALENARLYKAEQQRREEIEAMYQASLILTTSLNLNQVLPAILHTAQLLTAAEQAQFYLIDDQTVRLSAALDRAGQRPDPITQPLRSQRLAEQVAHTGEWTAVEDSRAHPLYAGEPWEIFAALGIPLKIETDCVGILIIEYAAPRRLTEMEHRKLEVFAAQAAMAVQNAQLHQQITRHAAELSQRVAERTAELNAERQHLQAILDSAGEGIQIMDSAGRIEYANPATEQLTGFSAEDMVGKVARLWETLFGATSQADQAWQQLQQGQAWRGEVVNQRHDGARYDSAVTVTPLTDQHQHITGYVAVHRDITYLKELERLKGLFVQRIGHELRMPLAIIKGRLELLERGKRDKLDEYIQTMLDQSRRQKQLLDSFLEISEIDAGLIATQPTKINLNQVVKELLMDRREQLHERALTLSEALGEQLPQRPLTTDRTLAAKALGQLLDNAVNYTPRGGHITVTTAMRSEGDHTWCTVAVHNSGPGVSAEEMAHVFERFYRGEAARDYKVPGAGLGLAIAQVIMHQLGGRLVVDSQPDEGVTFTIWLPLAS